MSSKKLFCQVFIGKENAESSLPRSREKDA
jgi:hypothetical protein